MTREETQAKLRERYDDIEMHPCVGLDENNNVTKDHSKVVGYEQCDENDPDIIVWSVYGHCKEGGIECIGDSQTKEDAEIIYYALMAFLEN